MNRLKLTLIILGSLAAVVLAAVVLAFSSGFQTWAARRALAGQPGLKAEIGTVSAGLSSAELRNVRVEQDGVTIVAKEITAAYSAMDYISGRRINVASVAVRGLEIDARKSAAGAKRPPVAAQAAVAPFAGILNAIRLPGEIRLGRLDLDAKVLLPDDQTATLTLEGGGIAPGEFGTIKWKATFADSRKGAALTAAQTSGEIKLRTTADLRIDAIQVNGEAGATGANLPSDRVKFELKLAQPAANAGETINATVGLVRGPAVEQLFDTQVTYAAGKPTLSGVWKLAVRSEQLAAVLSGLGLPEVALAGEGRFTFNLETSAATASGALTGTISKLEKLGAELAAIGPLQIRAAFDGGSSKDAAQLGKLEFDVATTDGRKLVAVAAQQKLSFSFKDQKITPERPGAELARVSLIGVPLAWAQSALKPRTITSGDLSGVFVVVAELDGSRVKLSSLEPLTLRSVTLREGEKILADRVTLSVSPRVDYTAARIVAELEKLAISTADGDSLTGSLSAEVTTGSKPATTFATQLEGRLATLVKPYLPADVGALTLAVKTQGRLEGNSLQISALKLQVDREGGAVLVAIEALQPLAADIATQKVSAPSPAAPAARVRWGDIPLAWVEPYVAQSKLSGQLSAATIEVTLPGADAINVRATDKISARNLIIAMNGQEFLRGADFSTDLNATWKTGTLTADIRQLDLRQGTASLLSAAVAGEVTPGKTLRATGRGTVSADFAVLAKQPALAAQIPLLRGNVSVKFDGAVADGVTGKVTISAQNLVARAGALALGAMDLSVDAKLDANNAGTVRNVLVVTKDGRRSDLTIDGKVSVKPGAVSFDGRITGDQINVDDMQAFSALAEPPPPTAASLAKSPALNPAPSPAPRRPAAPAAPVAATLAPKPTGPVRDTSPVWAGFSGRVDLNIKTIKQGTANTITNLVGLASARDDRLATEGLSFQLNGNSFKAMTILTFDVKQARPYALVGTFDMPSFDVGNYLRKADPGVPAALETTITIASKFSGTALNLAEMQDRAIGSFELRGSKGVLRALNQKAETASNTATAVSIGASLLGAALGGKAQGIGDKIAGGAADAAELARLLKDMPFDSVVIQGERIADGTLSLKSLDFLSPEVHLTGSGRVDMRPGVAVVKSPLALQLQLAGKNRVAGALDKLRQLDGKKDAAGFYMMQTPFSLSGTVEKPDSSEFWKNLTMNTAGGFLR